MAALRSSHFCVLKLIFFKEGSEFQRVLVGEVRIKELTDQADDGTVYQCTEQCAKMHAAELEQSEEQEGEEDAD